MPSNSLFERYRPTVWDEVVGQDKAIKIIRGLKGGVGGRAFWITGASGTGKTTIARILVGALADPFNVNEVDAGEVTLPYLREAEHVSGFYGMGSLSGRAWIVNEAHGLRKDAIRRLLVMLEQPYIPLHTCWVFTTTCDGQEELWEDHVDAGPLLSRCIPIALARRDLAKPFAERAKQIAEREGDAALRDGCTSFDLGLGIAVENFTKLNGEWVCTGTRIHTTTNQEGKP